MPIAKLHPVDSRSIGLAVQVIRKGGVVAFPTDTVYGLGCDPFSEAAVCRLFDVKGRDAKPIPVLCGDFSAAERLVSLNTRARELAQVHWPGPLTIVAPLRVKVPTSLDQGSGWLGVRVPNSDACAALLRGVGGYVTGTSANLSGMPSSRTAEEVVHSLGERVNLILDGGRLGAPESTVVRVDGKGVEVLRRGKISFESRRGGMRKRTL